MKKLMLIIVLGLMAITALSAHPAANVKAQYDAKTSILTVEYGHKVRDASDHYIFNVMIEVNGKKMVEQNLSAQESLDGGTLVYKLANLTKGDQVKVTTDCNKGGKKSTTLNVP